MKRCCFNCGERVDEQDWEYLGNSRIWVCGERECQAAMRDEQRYERLERATRAKEDDYYRY